MIWYTYIPLRINLECEMQRLVNPRLTGDTRGVECTEKYPQEVVPAMDQVFNEGTHAGNGRYGSADRHQYAVS
jgi:hypothetical protein